MSSPEKTSNLIDMVHYENQFVSFIESHIEETNQLYARFHLGTFVSGQALTVANALRRSLLSDIPSWLITSVEIDGINHEFATFSGIQENVLNILLNLKGVVLTNSGSKSTLNSSTKSLKKLNASISFSGPGILTAADIKFPPEITCTYPNHYIATVSSTGKFQSNLVIEYIDPVQEIEFSRKIKTKTNNQLLVNSTPKPIRQVNFTIHKLSNFQNQEYISIEILTDGSIHPKEALDISLEKLTKVFYGFAKLSKESLNPILKS